MKWIDDEFLVTGEMQNTVNSSNLRVPIFAN